MSLRPVNLNSLDTLRTRLVLMAEFDHGKVAREGAKSRKEMRPFSGAALGKRGCTVIIPIPNRLPPSARRMAFFLRALGVRFAQSLGFFPCEHTAGIAGLVKSRLMAADMIIFATLQPTLGQKRSRHEIASG